MSVCVSVWVYQGLSSQCGVVSDWDGKKKREGREYIYVDNCAFFYLSFFLGMSSC